MRCIRNKAPATVDAVHHETTYRNDGPRRRLACCLIMFALGFTGFAAAIGVPVHATDRSGRADEYGQTPQAVIAVDNHWSLAKLHGNTFRPHIFLPSVISTAAPEIAPAFLEGGRALFFSRRKNNRWSIVKSEYRGGSWSPPAVAPFSGTWNDLEAAAAPSGQYLIFASDRPRPGEKTRVTAHYYGREQVGGMLWRVTLRGNSAGAPTLLPNSVNKGASVWTPSIAADDDLVFMRTDVGSGRFRLFLAKSDGKDGYSSVQPLAFSTGAANDVDPAIDPAERFLIFSSDRDTPGRNGKPGVEHLFIAFSPLSANPVVCPLHFPGWSDPKVSEVEARLSLDGKRLYFASGHSAHAPGKPANGPWDNGKFNIWVVHLSPDQWRRLPTHSSDSSICAAPQLQALTPSMHGRVAALLFSDPRSGRIRGSNVLIRENGRWHALYSQQTGIE